MLERRRVDGVGRLKFDFRTESHEGLGEARAVGLLVGREGPPAL